MANILDRIVANKLEEIAWAKTLLSEVELERRVRGLSPSRDFAGALVRAGTVAVIGTLLRTLAWPGWAVTVTQGAALLLVITWMFAGHVARLGFIPDPDVWHEFAALAERGSDVVNNDVAPVPVTEGVKFLVVIGVAFIAWVVDAVAVTWRQATMAGIPLLTLYLVPAIVLPDGVPWPLFLVAGAGWLLLLLTDGRRELMRWGRPVDDQGSNRLHSIAGTGRRLGAAALTVAVIVPVLLPSLDDGRFGFGGGDEGSTGGDGGGAGVYRAGRKRHGRVHPEHRHGHSTGPPRRCAGIHGGVGRRGLSHRPSGRVVRSLSGQLQLRDRYARLLAAR